MEKTKLNVHSSRISFCKKRKKEDKIADFAVCTIYFWTVNVNSFVPVLAANQIHHHQLEQPPFLVTDVLLCARTRWYRIRSREIPCDGDPL